MLSAKLWTFACGCAAVAAQDRLVASLITSLDPLGVISTTSAFKMSDVFFAVDRKAVRDTERAFFQTASGDTRDYASVFVSDDRAASHVLVVIHGGFFTSNDRYDISAWMLSLALAADKPLVSLQYPLLRQRGWTRDVLDASLNESLAAVRAIFPAAGLVLLGASAGGTLVMDLASRNATGVVAAVADSPNVCMSALVADFEATDDVCYLRRTVDLGRADFLVPPLADMCFDDLHARTAVPVFVLFPKHDIIIPQAQFDRYMARTPDTEWCVDPLGLHGNAASLAGCLPRLLDWLDGRTGLAVARAAYAARHGAYELRQAFGYAFQALAPLRISCGQLCLTWGWDPVVYALQDCADVPEVSA